MEIKFTIAGEQYILIEMLVTPRSGLKLIDRYKKYNVIEQGIKEIKFPSTFDSRTYSIQTVLVPERNLIAFNKEGLEDL